MPIATSPATSCDLVEMRELHRAGMKCRDLVVVEIRRDEGLCGEGPVDDPDVLDADAARREPVSIGREIVTGGGHRQCDIAEQVQVVGDVRRATAELAAHFRHQERDVQDVDLVRKNVLCESVGEYENRVISHRTADQCGLPAASFESHPSPAPYQTAILPKSHWCRPDSRIRPRPDNVKMRRISHAAARDESNLGEHAWALEDDRRHRPHL